MLRVLSVEERVGIARARELVRAPIFFAAGECGSVDELALIAADDASGAPVPLQLDDVRRGPDGGVSRVHVWFEVDLAGGAKRRFHLVSRRDASAGPSGAVQPAIKASAGSGEIRFATAQGWVAWSSRGELRGLSGAGGAWEFTDRGAFPRAQLQWAAKDNNPGLDVLFDREAEPREVAWASGPLFAKLRVRLPGPDGSALEQEFRVPRHGREVIVTTTLYTGTRVGVTVKENQLLEGELKRAGGGEAQIVRVPAGLRFDLRAEHAYTITALTRRGKNQSLLAVPLVVGGRNGAFDLVDGEELKLQGVRGLQHGNEGEKDSLRAFWTEVRLVTAAASEPDELWRVYRQHVQPLVAVVDEPGVTTEHLHAALQAIAREMKPIGWRQEAARALVLGDEARMTKILAQPKLVKESDADALLRGARNAHAKLTNNGQRKLREDEKGRGYGGLDPYHITYTQSAAAALAAMPGVTEQVSSVNLAMARAVREAGGRVDSAGNPYIDCFSRTLNMQMGPVLFGLTAGKKAGDTELVRFYRDLATSPPVQAVFGRAQRPYTGAPAKSADQTDYLYQAICDFWLRTAELLGEENLQLHPLAYSRYTDCMDVMADRYHGDWAKDKAPVSRARANFFRGQAHTHRWLGWSAAPFIRLLEDPEEKASVGLTEAVRFAQARKGHWKNWPDLTFYLLADLLVNRELTQSQRPALPAPPIDLKVEKRGGAHELTWSPVPTAAAYRIYRAEKAGGPYRLLNSPHVEGAAPPLTKTAFRDDNPGATAHYVVTAIDENGRESPWRAAP